MAGSIFARRTTHRYPLDPFVNSDGGQNEQWFVVRDELTYYERQTLNSAMVALDMSGDEAKIAANVGKYYPAILESYIVDWHVFDDDGSPVLFTKEALAGVADDVATAVVKHIDDARKEQEEAKKARSTAIAVT